MAAANGHRGLAALPAGKGLSAMSLRNRTILVALLALLLALPLGAETRTAARPAATTTSILTELAELLVRYLGLSENAVPAPSAPAQKPQTVNSPPSQSELDIGSAADPFGGN